MYLVARHWIRSEHRMSLRNLCLHEIFVNSRLDEREPTIGKDVCLN